MEYVYLHSETPPSQRRFDPFTQSNLIGVIEKPVEYSLFLSFEAGPPSPFPVFHTQVEYLKLHKISCQPYLFISPRFRVLAILEVLYGTLVPDEIGR